MHNDADSSIRNIDRKMRASRILPFRLVHDMDVSCTSLHDTNLPTIDLRRTIKDEMRRGADDDSSTVKWTLRPATELSTPPTTYSALPAVALILTATLLITYVGVSLVLWLFFDSSTSPSILQDLVYKTIPLAVSRILILGMGSLMLWTGVRCLVA